MIDAEKKFRELVRKLHALAMSDNAGEANNARKKLLALLAKRGKTARDIPDLLRTDEQQTQQSSAGVGAQDIPDLDGGKVFDALYHTLQDFVIFQHERVPVALALWAMHSFVYDQFSHTPRIALLSPTPGVGKTTLRDLLIYLTLNAQPTDDISPAGLFRTIEYRRPCTILMDEIDNMHLGRTGRRTTSSAHARNGLRFVRARGLVLERVARPAWRHVSAPADGNGVVGNVAAVRHQAAQHLTERPAPTGSEIREGLCARRVREGMERLLRR